MYLVPSSDSDSPVYRNVAAAQFLSVKLGGRYNAGTVPSKF